MAATASPGGQGAAGVSSTKALLLIFSLLSLVHATASLVDKDHLEILQEYFEKGINEAARKKALYDYVCVGATAMFQEKLEQLHPTLKQLEADVHKFPRLQGLVNIINAFLEKEVEKFSDEIAAREQELKDIWDFIKARESDHDDDL